MELESIRIIVALTEHGSTQRAAKHSPYSRATIRRRLESLEAELGVKLFHRTSGGLVPTDPCRVLARRGREMLAEADALAHTVRQVGGSPRGRVRLAIPSGMPPSAIVGFRRAVASVLPEIRFDVRIGHRPLDKLFDEIDLAVTFREPPTEGPFEATPVGVAFSHLLASPEYLAANGPIETADAVVEHPLFAWIPPDEPTPTRLTRHDGPDLPIEPVYASEDIFALRCLAAAGEGIAWAPDGYAEPLEGADLVRVLPEVFGEPRPLWIVVAKANADAPAVRAVLRVARAVLAAGGATAP